MAYNPDASRNLTYPNSIGPASITAFADAAPAGSYTARLKGEVAMWLRERGPDHEYTQAARKRLHDHLMLTGREHRAGQEERAA
jgi:hypothetical protein